MQVLKKGREFVKLKVEVPEDLILLDAIIEKGDIIGGKTVRISKVGRSQEKRIVYLKISVEKKKFEGGRLRITGKITEGPEEIERGYHTFEIKEGTEIEIFKRIDEKIMEKIRESEKFKKKVYVITVDYGKISIFEVRNFEIEEIFEASFGIPGKNDPKARERALSEFFTFVNRKIEEMERKSKYVVVVGNKFLLEKIRARKKVESPHYGIVAVKEVLKRREMLEFLKDMDISRAWEVYEEYLKRISKDDERIATGIEEIRERAKEGRVEIAVLPREFLKDHLDLIKEIEEKGGRVILVGRGAGELGHLVEHSKGIAILRW